MEISVWHVEEEIARRWLIVSVISTCGRDYMLMYLHFACGPVCCMLLQRFKGSGQSVMCFLIDKTVILSKMWPLGLQEEQSPYCLMSHSKSSFVVNAAGYPTEMLHVQCHQGQNISKKRDVSASTENLTCSFSSCLLDSLHQEESKSLTVCSFRKKIKITWVCVLAETSCRVAEMSC